jgi:hypothetical protein
MRTCLFVALTVVLCVGCKSSSQTPGDGGPPDLADDHHVGPEINLGSDASDAADAKDAKDGPPPCTGPKCPVVLATDSDPRCCVVADGTYVYWVSNSGSLSYPIMRVASAGGTPEYFESSEFGVSDMVIRNGVLYWAASNGIFRRDLAAARGSATKIASGSPNFGPIGVDANFVYWADVGGDLIHKTPVAGGTTVDFATATQAQYVAADGTNVYWSDQDLMGGAFVMLPIGGGTPTVLATDLTNPGEIAVDGANVYFANSSTLFGTKFWKVPPGGGTPVMVALSPNFGTYEIAADATSLYLAGYNAIGKVAIASGSIETIASGQAAAMDIALDANNIYWMNSDDGARAIMKLAK